MTTPLFFELNRDRKAPVYRAALLAGVPHGFTTRVGGVSEREFATLDLNCAGDGGQAATPRADVAENYRLALDAIGCTGRTAVWIAQVHGNGVVEVDLRGSPVAPASIKNDTGAPARLMRCGQGDALITTDPGVVLTVRVADCVPILLASRAGDVVAAVHAGWRGVVADVLGRTLGVMRDRYGISRGEVVAAVGPCIGLANFEVGAEVADQFEAAGLASTVERRRWPKPHVDLAAACALQLKSHGVPDAQIAVSGECTFASADLFYSHRRDAGKTGRQAAMIGVRAAE
jgi:YfiH family protein